VVVEVYFAKFLDGLVLLVHSSVSQLVSRLRCIWESGSSTQSGQIRSQCHPVKMNCSCKRLLFSTESTTMRQLLLQTILAKIDPNRYSFITIPPLCLEKRIYIFFLLEMKSGTGWSIRWKLMRHFAALATSSVVDAWFNPMGDVLTKPLR